MKKTSNTLIIALSALVVLGMIAIAGHAQKIVPLASAPKPVVSLDGEIYGSGDPRWISITFRGSSFGVTAGYSEGDHTFISNPDYPPSLGVYTDLNTRPHLQMLSYFYCDALTHDPGVSLCNVPDLHSPQYYKRLKISGGIVAKGNRQVIFPTGSAWEIVSKKTNLVEKQGHLAGQVIYTVIK